MKPGPDGLDWTRDAPTWPLSDSSRFVEAGGLRWHVQVNGSGPILLLVHGTAASTHSWRELVPFLVSDFTVVAVDLPGHGFTSPPSERAGWTLAGMASGFAALCRTLEIAPALVVGHSAGAAILVEAVLGGAIAPHTIVSLNGALLPFRGVARFAFPAMARLLFLNPLVPAWFAWRGRQPGVIAGLIADTGSSLSPEGMSYYQRLMSDRRHVAAALSMMANWDLARIERTLPRLATPLVLVAGLKDRAVPAEDAWRVRDRLPTAQVVTIAGAGHLAHEERPAEIAELIRRYASVASAECIASGAATPAGSRPLS